jgi:hypothetical protein
VTTSYVTAHTWDPPYMTSHFGTFHKQLPVNPMVPWMKTLCGRSVLANGDRSGAYPCEECQDKMDEEWDDDEAG